MCLARLCATFLFLSLSCLWLPLSDSRLCTLLAPGRGDVLLYFINPFLHRAPGVFSFPLSLSLIFRLSFSFSFGLLYIAPGETVCTFSRGGACTISSVFILLLPISLNNAFYYAFSFPTLFFRGREFSCNYDISILFQVNSRVSETLTRVLLASFFPFSLI